MNDPESTPPRAGSPRERCPAEALLPDPRPVASPAASGPAGSLFEGQVGAHYLLTLLAEAAPRGLPGCAIRSVKLQRSVEGHPLDDVIVHASDDDGREHVLEVQAKRTVRFAPADPVFRDVVHQLARAVQGLDRSGSRLQFAVATERTSFKASGPYQDVLRWARELESAQVFMGRVNREGVGSDDMRTFVRTVRTHLATGGCDDDDVTVWEALRRFQILAFDFDAPGSQSEELALERAAGVLADADAGRASALWKVLTETAIRHAASAGSVDRAGLVSELTGPDGFRLRGSRPGRRARSTLAEEARLAAADLRGRVAGVRLARSERLQAVRSAMDAGRYVEIRGGPGVGKSGLLGMLIDETLASGEALILTPQRTVAGGWAAFKARLGISAGSEAFLADLASDGGATIFIDSADFFDDPAKRVTVSDIVRSAAGVPGVRVVVTARTRFDMEEPNWLPSEARSALGAASPVMIEELSAGEIDELTASAPALSGLLSDAHPARDVARNLFRLSRLVELRDDDGEIHSEADLLHRWWTTADGPTARRRERKRLIADLADAALAGVGELETDADAAIVDELVASATLRELALDRIAFEHDVLREWAVAARVHDDPARLTAVDRTRPVPATIARGVELAARLALERSNDGDAWTTLVDSLSDATAHASWRRWALLAILRSERAEDLLDRAARVLLSGQGALLRELIRTALAVESEPVADLVARLGGDPGPIPRGLNGPSNGSWARLARWLLLRRADLPIEALADVTQLFQSLSGSMFFSDPLTPLMAEALADWLEEIEAAQDHSPFEPAALRFSRLRFHALGELATDVRTAFLLMAMRVPDRAKAYLSRLRSRRNPDDAVREIMRFRGTLPRAAPTELVDLTVDRLIPKASRDEGRGGSRRDEPFEFLDKSFLPASPAQGPFLDLLHAAPTDGLRLIRSLVGRATAWRSGGREPADDGFELNLREGPRFFPWIRSYAWSRQMDGGYAVESGLMALEAWSHHRIECGDPVDDVIGDILGPDGSPACQLLVAVDVLISHWPATAEAAIPLLGCPELLCVDRERHTHDAMPKIDLFGFGDIGPKEPGGQVSTSDLKARRSRRFALEGLLSWFAAEEPGRDRLRHLLAQASARLGPPEPEDTFAVPRFMARHALNLIEPSNWRGSGANRAYVQPAEEAEHVQALQSRREAKARDWGVDAAIHAALEHPERSGPDLATRALSYAQRLQDASEDEEDTTSNRAHTLIAAALIVARDSTEDLLGEVEGWVRSVFADALAGEDDIAGSTFRGGIKFNPPAIATLGLIHLWNRGRGDERPALLSLAGRSDPAAARGVQAGIDMILRLDPRMPQALLRCALVAQIHPEVRWDTPEEVKTAGEARRSDAVGRAVSAERAWLLKGAPKPKWPRLPDRAIHLRARRSVGSQRTARARRSVARPTEHFRTQTSAVWLRAAAGPAGTGDDKWLVGLVETLRHWTARANGAGQDRDAEIGSRCDEWNAAFLPLMARAIPLVSAARAERWVAALADIPDETFFDVVEHLVPALDLQFFRDGGLAVGAHSGLREALAARLQQSRGWQGERTRNTLAVEMRIGPAIAPFFFCQYNALTKSSCYLLPAGIDRVGPLLPLVCRLIKDGPVPFTSQLVMNLVEVSPRPSLLDFVLGSSMHWLACQPSNTVVWIDSGLGSRIVRWIEMVVADWLPDTGSAIRRSLDDVLARLVQIGVAEAHRLEDVLAGRGAGGSRGVADSTRS